MAIHFIGFKTNTQKFNNACRVFGPPDFVHYNWDVRAAFGGELHPADVLVFAEGTSKDTPQERAYNDSEVQ